MKSFEAQWVGCLPNILTALGLIPSPVQTGWVHFLNTSTQEVEAGWEVQGHFGCTSNSRSELHESLWNKAAEMGQPVRAPATKPNGPSSIPGIRMKERESWLLQMVFLFLHGWHYTCASLSHRTLNRIYIYWSQQQKTAAATTKTQNFDAVLRNRCCAIAKQELLC